MGHMQLRKIHQVIIILNTKEIQQSFNESLYKFTRQLEIAHEGIN